DLIKFINSKMIMEKPNWSFYPGAQVIMEQRLLDFVRAGLNGEETLELPVLDKKKKPIHRTPTIWKVTETVCRDMKLVSKEKVGTQTNGDEDNSTKRRKTSER
ncbi:unnamed protein product, partial [Didymodactylos carnosus]